MRTQQQTERNEVGASIPKTEIQRAQTLATSPAKLVSHATVPMQLSGIHDSVYGPKINLGRRYTTRRRYLTKRIPKAKKQDELQSSSNLGVKLLGDATVATGVTFAVSPFLTVIDKSIVQRAAGTHTTSQSIAETLGVISKNPAAYVKSPTFLLMWGVYAATYTVANSLKTIVEHKEHHPRPRKDKSRGGALTHNAGPKGIGTMGVFVGTSITNSGLSMLKDKAYARMFGTVGTAAKVPLITYGLWASRDFMVVGSSFILPEKVSNTLAEQTNMNRADALRVAQFACPVATQFVAGPVQLLGLDFYNRPLSDLSYSRAFMERASFLYRGAASVIGARVARIAPGYGIGGIGNTYFRDAWREMLIRKEMKALVEGEDEDDVRDSARKLVQLVRNRDMESKNTEKLVTSTYKV